MSDHLLDDTEHISLCEALDRILYKGAVVAGDLTISVANIDLLYLELRVLLASIEKMREITKLDSVEISGDKQ
jgi:hypothetical protein